MYLTLDLIMAWYINHDHYLRSTALLPSINIINVSALWSPMIGEFKLTITWDLEYNCTLNSSGTLNTTNYTINTSNCGMCPNATSSTFAMCNVITSDLLDDTCNVTVVVHAMVCGIATEATSEQYSVRLINGKTHYELIRATKKIIIQYYALKLQ